MPSRKVHNLLAKILLGKDYDEVNKLKDLPSLLLGPSHRVVFHDPLSNVLIGYLYDDPKALLAAVLHDIVDKAFTNMSDEEKVAFLVYLGLLGEKYGYKRKRGRPRKF